MDMDEGIPWGLWGQMVSRALGGKRGQAALSELESALRALPERKLVAGHLAAEGSVCTVGAYVAAKRAQRDGIDLAVSIEQMVEGTPCRCDHAKDMHDEAGCHATRRSFQSEEEHECSCMEYRPEDQYAHDTAQEGQAYGLKWTVAWHLAYLNDEEFGKATPEERYELVLAWVQRAQGKEPANAAV